MQIENGKAKRIKAKNKNTVVDVQSYVIFSVNAKF